MGRRKDAACDMIHKPEHTADLESGAILAAEVLPGDLGDAQGFAERILAASALATRWTLRTLRTLRARAAPEMAKRGVVEEIVTGDGAAATKRDVVADAGYHQKDELEMLASTGHRPVIPDPSNRALPDAEREPEAHAAALASREACASQEGKDLLEARSEKVERSFARVLDSGGMRRTTLRGLRNINKRYQVAVAASNLSVLMRKVFGYRTVKQYVAGTKAGKRGRLGPICAALTPHFAWRASETPRI